MGTERSPAVRIYRRAAPRFEALREMLARHDFHAVVPPDALAEWEAIDDRRTRVRAWAGVVLVEAADDAAAGEFDARHRIALPSDGEIPDGGAGPEFVDVIAGSDEAGKGERGRALAVAAVTMPMAIEDEAIARGIRDSKLCTVGEIAELARWIARHVAHEVCVRGGVARETALREAGGNETRLLAGMHAEALRTLHGRTGFALARVDRFAPRRPVAAVFTDAIVDECVRGERHVACAAASILARDASLRA